MGFNSPVHPTSPRSGDRSRNDARSRTIADHRGDPWPVHGSEVQPAPNEEARFFSAEGRDARSRSSAMRSSCPPIHELRPVACCRPPRNPGQRNDSKLGAVTRFAVLFGSFQHLVQATGCGITLNLMVPLVRDKLLKPSRKDGKLLGRELRHRVLDFLNAHESTLRLDSLEIKGNGYSRFPIHNHLITWI